MILEVDVPDWIIERVGEWFPASQGLIQFNPGAGLEELVAAWPTLPRAIRSLS